MGAIFNLEALVFAIFLMFAGLYALFIPSFEGPDESEHCRYVQAYAENAKIHPLDPKAPFRWGYEVHHPPLYYWLVGQYAKLVGPEFHRTLTINRRQNPRFPFIRHDLPGHRFPFDAVHRGLRLLRLPSVLIGLVTFVVICLCFRRLFPDDRATRCFLLTAAMLAPNSLQVFGTVANDGLNLLFSVAALCLALRIVRQRAPSSALFFCTGLLISLGIVTKLTNFITLASVVTLWGVDAVGNRRLPLYVKGLVWFLLPVLVIDGPYFYHNAVTYHSPTRERVLWMLTPAFYRDSPLSVSYILHHMARDLPSAFAADLCWQTVHLPGLSPYLFWLWLAGAVVSIAWSWRTPSLGRFFCPEPLISIIAIFWATVFIVLANRHWGNPQIRFGWCVYPLTVMALAYLLRAIPTGYLWWRRVFCLGAVLFAVAVNVHVLWTFQGFYGPGLDTHNRDYETYLYTRVLDRHRGTTYLLFGNALKEHPKGRSRHPEKNHGVSEN